MFGDPNSLAGVPYSRPATPGGGSFIAEQYRHRPLICGLQIQNIDHDVRSGAIASGSMTVGTLGCFVTVRGNTIALLTNNHVAAAENAGVVGQDRILQPGGVAHGGADHAAILSGFAALRTSPVGATLLRGNVIWNEIDAAVATLLPGQAWTQQYLPIRPARGPTGVAAPTLNDRVHKVGRTTGLTWGEIKQVGVTVGPIGYRMGPCWFRQTFVIEGMHDTIFSDAGDSGSAIVRDSDGMVLGLVYAGNDTQTYACPITPILTALQCRLA